jgi:hypothetical protein
MSLVRKPKLGASSTFARLYPEASIEEAQRRLALLETVPKLAFDSEASSFRRSAYESSN